MSARLLALAFALLFAAAPISARARMSYYGTKNFTPAPGTPSYFVGERGIPYTGHGEFAGPARRVMRGTIGPRSPAAAVRLRGDPYARPIRPARVAAASRRPYRSAIRLAHARSWRSRSWYARSRALRLARLRRERAWRLYRLRRLRELRLARLRRERAWRR